MKTELSEKLFAKAQTLFPGGVNRPVRAFRGVGGTPRFIARGRGSHLVDVDGNDYVDYVLSWGPMIVGHAHPEVMREVQDAMKEGASFGAPLAARDPARRARARADALGREDALLLLGHRGDHRRDPRRARLHRPRRHPQVRGLLPRRGGSAPREGRLGRRDARAPGLARRARRTLAKHTLTLPYNDLAAVGAALRRARARPSPASSSSRWSATWACSSRSDGYLAGPRSTSAASTARSSSWTR